MNDPHDPHVRTRLALTADFVTVTLHVAASEAAEWLGDFHSVREIRRMTPSALNKAIADAAYRRAASADVTDSKLNEIRSLITTCTIDPDPEPDPGGANVHVITNFSEVPSVFNTGTPPDPPRNDQDSDQDRFEPMDTVTKSGTDQ